MRENFPFLVYRSAEEDVSVNAVIKDDSIWLTQKTMAELFEVDKSTISRHLKNIFQEGELREEVVVAKIATTTPHGAMEGKTQAKEAQFYNLDAITGHTGAEIVYAGADRTKPNMGLTTWKNAPDGRILKSDVRIAKNYLTARQIRQLEWAVSGYFYYIEDLIERENTFTMEEFAASVNEFLAFRRYDILKDRGSASHQKAIAKADEEYDAFNRTQKIVFDFDREVRRMLESGENQ